MQLNDIRMKLEEIERAQIEQAEQSSNAHRNTDELMLAIQSLENNVQSVQNQLELLKNEKRGMDEDLNAPGSSFVPLAFDQSTHLPQLGVRPGASAPNRFYMYGVIGRLAMLAASYELESTDPQAERYD